MGLVADITTCKTGTGVAGSTVDVVLTNHADANKAPKVIWVYAIGRTDDTDAQGAANLNFSYGFATSTSKRRALGGQSQTAVSPTSADSMMRDDCVMASLDTSGVVNGRLDVNAIATGSVQFIVDQQFPSDFTCLVIALGGTDITDTTIVDFTAQTQAVSVGFLAEYIEGMSMFTNSITFPLSRTFLVNSLGRCDGNTLLNQVLGEIINDASVTADTAASLNDVNFAESHVVGGPVVRMAITAVSATGFTVTVAEGSSAVRLVSALCIGGRFKLATGNVLSQTDTVTAAEASMSFSPVLTNVWSHCAAETATDANNAPAALSVGSFLSFGTSNACIAYVDPETNPSSTATAINLNNCYVNLADDGSIDGSGEATGGEVPPTTGFRILMNDADPSQAFLAYVSFGDSGLPDVTKVLNVGRRGGGVGFRKWN
jgi:hypothetical protein